MGHSSLKGMKPWVSNAAYSITLLLLGAIMGNLVDKYLKAGFNSDYLIMTTLLLVQMTILAYARNHLFEDADIKSVLHDIEHRLGLEVLYQDVNTLNKSKIDHVKEVVSAAEQEILILACVKSA